MKLLAVTILLISLRLLCAGDLIPLPEAGWQEDFSRFEGTFESLPAGITVSQDGTNLMAADNLDFRGINDGDISTGGCYAWDTGTNDFALGYQPTSDEFTPGFFEASFSNSADIVYRFIKVEYDFVARNNENRSSKLELQILMPDGSMGTASTLSTEQGEDVPALWKRIRSSCLVQLPQPIAPDEVFRLRWCGDDDGGSGSRDEYGIDNIRVRGIRSIGTVITVR